MAIVKRSSIPEYRIEDDNMRNSSKVGVEGVRSGKSAFSDPDSFGSKLQRGSEPTTPAASQLEGEAIVSLDTLYEVCPKDSAR
jgi:hypothetical protein